MLLDGRIDMGHARALLGVGKAKQVELAGAGGRARACRCARPNGWCSTPPAAPKAGAGRQAPRSTPTPAACRRSLSESLGATVSLKPRKGGRGSLVIDYASLEQLDGIVSRLKRR